MAEQLNNILHQAGLINVVATVYGTKIFLEGTVSSKDELKRAELITTAMGEKVENLLKIGEKLLVAIEVNFVEVKRSSLDKIGVKLLPNVAGDGSIGFTMVESLVGAGSQNQQNLDITAGAAGKIGLDMIFNKGYARILSRPKLVCASGGKAKFHAGGEVPIPMITGNSATVEYKEFGVILNVVPTADHMGNITVKIEVEVSDVDRSLAVTASVGTFHGFSITKGETIMTLKHGETIIISGLFNNTEQKDVGKFPGLGHIPILGEFFKSREFAAKKSELAIFVTPRIVSPKSEYLETTLDNIKKRYKKADEEVHFSIFD